MQKESCKRRGGEREVREVVIERKRENAVVAVNFSHCSKTIKYKVLKIILQIIFTSEATLYIITIFSAAI